MYFPNLFFMLRNFILLSAFVLCFSLLSCDLNAQKPDKRILATLELTKENPSEKEIQAAAAALIDRFQNFGSPLSEISVTSEGKIELTIETLANVDQVRLLLTRSGNLGFYPVIKNEETTPFIIAVNDMLGQKDSMSIDPLFSKITDGSSYNPNGMFAAKIEDTAVIGSYFRIPETRALLPSAFRAAKFFWSKEVSEENTVRYFAVNTEDGAPFLDGGYVSMATMGYDMAGRPTIDFRINSEGAKIWEEMTARAYREQSLIAIVVDGLVYSAPGVSNGPIKGGRVEIAGNYTEEEAQELAMLIDAGAIPNMTLLEISSQPMK